MEQPYPESVHSDQLFQALLRNSKRHALLLVMVFSAGFLILRFEVLRHSATTTIVVIDGMKSDVRNPDRLPDFLLTSDQFNRTNQVVFSDEMYGHLIGHFKLYARMGIDSLEPGAYRRAVSGLRKSIDIKKTPYNAAVITVKDHDPDFACTMADEIASFTDTLNRKWLIHLQEKRASVYKAVLDEMGKTIEEKQTDLREIIRTIPEYDNGGGGVAREDLSRSVNGLTASLEAFRKEALQYDLVLQSLRSDGVSTVWQQQKALPDEEDLTVMAVLWSAMVAFLFFLLIVLFHYYRLMYYRKTDSGYNRS
ncbi:MAG: hypothetical protein RL213_1263 [Bacteroidota bacterium]|jgi:hypothetical protein